MVLWRILRRMVQPILRLHVPSLCRMVRRMGSLLGIWPPSHACRTDKGQQLARLKTEHWSRQDIRKQSIDTRRHSHCQQNRKKRIHRIGIESTERKGHNSIQNHRQNHSITRKCSDCCKIQLSRKGGKRLSNNSPKLPQAFDSSRNCLKHRQNSQRICSAEASRNSKLS